MRREFLNIAPFSNVGRSMEYCKRLSALRAIATFTETEKVQSKHPINEESHLFPQFTRIRVVIFKRIELLLSAISGPFAINVVRRQFASGEYYLLKFRRRFPDTFRTLGFQNAILAIVLQLVLRRAQRFTRRADRVKRERWSGRGLTLAASRASTATPKKGLQQKNACSQ